MSEATERFKITSPLTENDLIVHNRSNSEPIDSSELVPADTDYLRTLPISFKDNVRFGSLDDKDTTPKTPGPIHKANIPAPPGCLLDTIRGLRYDQAMNAIKMFCDEMSLSQQMIIPSVESLMKMPQNELGDFAKISLPRTERNIDMRFSFMINDGEIATPVGKELCDKLRPSADGQYSANNHAILVGKSGCGKTTAIFHAAKDAFCILTTASSLEEDFGSSRDPGGFDVTFAQLVADIKNSSQTLI